MARWTGSAPDRLAHRHRSLWIIPLVLPELLALVDDQVLLIVQRNGMPEQRHLRRTLDGLPVRIEAAAVGGAGERAIGEANRGGLVRAHRRQRRDFVAVANEDDLVGA